MPSPPNLTLTPLHAPPSPSNPASFNQPTSTRPTFCRTNSTKASAPGAPSTIPSALSRGTCSALASRASLADGSATRRVYCASTSDLPSFSVPDGDESATSVGMCAWMSELGGWGCGMTTRERGCGWVGVGFGGVERVDSEVQASEGGDEAARASRCRVVAFRPMVRCAEGAGGGGTGGDGDEDVAAALRFRLRLARPLEGVVWAARWRPMGARRLWESAAEWVVRQGMGGRIVSLTRPQVINGCGIIEAIESGDQEPMEDMLISRDEMKVVARDQRKNIWY